MPQADLTHIQPVSDYLFGSEVYKGIKEVVSRHELPTERVVEFFDLIDAIVAGTIALTHLPEIIGEAFGLEGDKTSRVTADIIGYCILPLEEYLTGVREEIVALGAKVEDFPAYRVPKEQLTIDQYAGRLTETHALTLAPHLMKRLGFLVKTYVEGGKNRDATMAFFQRAEAIGGLGLSEDVATKILTEVDGIRHGITFVDRMPEPAAPVAIMLPEIAPSHEIATTTPVIVGDTLKHLEEPAEIAPEPITVQTPSIEKRPEPLPVRISDAVKDTEEIVQHEKMLAKKGVTADGDEQVETAVKTAVDAASATLAVKRISKKAFADVARMTIKGVRDPYQTRAVLERDFSVTGEELVQLLEAIMLGLEEYHARPAEEVAVPVASLAPIAPHDSAEQQALDKRFAAAAGKLPTEKVEPIMPSARVSAARTKDEEVAAQTMAIDTEKLEQAAAASKPAQAKTMLTVGSVPPPQPGAQKVMTDVQFRPKLVGPVEELGTMSPADFRRLSSNPSDAAKKIEDILANLESVSYEERIRGIQAWRRSPMNVLYAQMAAEALQGGVALAEVASRRRNIGQESLSPAEMKSIASINASIQS